MNDLAKLAQAVRAIEEAYSNLNKVQSREELTQARTKLVEAKECIDYALGEATK
jgi:hypothetical protein